MISTAFGKVILLGEHAVVYGSPAIAVGIERGARAHARLAQKDEPSTLTLKGTRPVRTTDDGELPSAFREALDAAGATESLVVEADADLPAAAGLGCSAALAIAIARAIALALGQSVSPTETIARAMAWERVFHGNPSGIDATVSALGGCIAFVRGRPIERVALHAPLHLAVGHTGVASSTKTMVDAVARLRERRPDAAGKAFEGIASLVRNARLALEAGDLKTVGELMDLNQMLLSGLHVSTSEIESLCRIARAAGALGAKLTGAGGGGCVVALCESQPDDVIEAWRKAGFDAFASIVRPTESPNPFRALVLP